MQTCRGCSECLAGPKKRLTGSPALGADIARSKPERLFLLLASLVMDMLDLSRGRSEVPRPKAGIQPFLVVSGRAVCDMPVTKAGGNGDELLAEVPEGAVFKGIWPADKSGMRDYSQNSAHG